MKPEEIAHNVPLAERDRHRSIPEVLLDPHGQTPMQVYELGITELPKLVSQRGNQRGRGGATGWAPAL